MGDGCLIAPPHPLLVPALCAAVIAGALLLLWLVSLRLRNASIVDVFWGSGFVLVAAVTWAGVGCSAGPHALLVAGCTTAWGLRLSIHLALRNLGHGEDRRYQKLRARYAPFWWKSLFVVFGLQGVLLWVVSLPVQLGQRARPGPGLTALDVIGLGVFVFGLGLETIADAQLRAFTRDPASAGQVMDRGLWRWSRHPNYFGEIVLWWGLGLMAASTPGAWWAAIVGPAVITFLLVRVSGVPMLEAGMRQRRPGYVEYVARTRALVPWPRRTS